MKRIVFPVTNRVHSARQKSLVKELSKDFEVELFEPEIDIDDLGILSVVCSTAFTSFLHHREFDYALIRADRFELLPIAGICAYKGIPIIHIEGGADSGQRVIDTKIRDAITMLADIHLVTDRQAKKNVLSLGVDNVHNVGSLDVSFAKSVKPKRIIEEDYILLLHHAIPGEDTELVYRALSNLGHKVVGVKSNSDYQESLMHEEYSPEDFISLIYHAKAFVGNSSALCKESSILGTPSVLTGTRQDGRLTGHNVMRVPHKEKEIERATKYQIEHGRYEPDEIYYKPDTEQLISEIIKNYE